MTSSLVKRNDDCRLLDSYMCKIVKVAWNYFQSKKKQLKRSTSKISSINLPKQKQETIFILFKPKQ
jgi:tRNA(Phe) wybutosine-synthesizing methylase Tyw3